MGNMVRVRARVRGVRSLLQHHFGDDAIPLVTRERGGVPGNDPDEWKLTMMVNAAGELYVDPAQVFRMMTDAAKFTKKGRGSIQASVAATLQIEEEEIPLGRFMPAELTRDRSQPVYLDVRPVKNPGNGQRNVRYRLASGPGWECAFTLFWDKTIVSREQMRAVLRDASKLIGLGNGRQIGFGRFEVLSWEELSDAQEAPTAAAGGLGQPPPAEDVRKGRGKVPGPVLQGASTADSGNGAH